MKLNTIKFVLLLFKLFLYNITTNTKFFEEQKEELYYIYIIIEVIFRRTKGYS